MPGDRFILLQTGQARPGRLPLPPAFAVKAMTEDTEGRFSLLEVTVARDIPRHTHDNADECIYVLEGQLGIEFDNQGTPRPRACSCCCLAGFHTPCAAPPSHRHGCCRSPHPAVGSTTSRT
jgi:hypothetical protein